jgi:hypothetical protein
MCEFHKNKIQILNKDRGDYSMCEFVIKSIIEAVIISGIIVGFIKLLFEKNIEKYKNNEIIKQKAVLIADLLSEWISKPIPENSKKLNQLTLEAFIWLPKDIATKLSQLLSNQNNAPQLREIVAEVRKLMLNKNESIDPNIIILFDTETKKDKM